MNKCVGCGSLLQSHDKEKEGYTKDINNTLCERCFRIRHYNEYKLISKDTNVVNKVVHNVKKIFTKSGGKK